MFHVKHFSKYKKVIHIINKLSTIIVDNLLLLCISLFVVSRETFEKTAIQFLYNRIIKNKRNFHEKMKLLKSMFHVKQKIC